MSLPKVMMQCGHTPQGTDSNGKPVCVICIGIHPGADKVAEDKPNLEGRTAKCSYCKTIVKSDLSLPFFEYRPNREYDLYYCGCRGWD